MNIKIKKDMVETFSKDALESLIKELLTSAKIKKKYINTLLTPSSLSYYITAFTDPSYDSENNYEYLHALGTVLVHKLFVWYFFRKDPDIDQQILTQIKINFLKNSDIGQFMNNKFAPFILKDERVQLIDKIIQKVFESFVAATELIINRTYKVGIGYVVVNKLCSHIFDSMNLIIDKSNLENNKSKLKELYFDKNMSRYLPKYESVKEDTIFITKLFRIDKWTGEREQLGEGKGKLKVEGEQEAALQALILLEKQGQITLIEKTKDKIKQKHPILLSSAIFKAPRDESFNTFILSLLQRVYLLSDLKLESTDMQWFNKAFNHPNANSNENYELLETLGDNSVNNCVVWYISTRFPQLNTPEAIDILTRLKINIIKGEGLMILAKQLGFLDYITRAKDMGIILVQKMLEDVFEAFFAAIEIVIDNKYKKGMGYIACCKLLETILDQQSYSIHYDELVDAKTQLKERVYDVDQKNIKVKYVCSKTIDNNDKAPKQKYECKAQLNALNEEYTTMIEESRVIGKHPDGTDIFSPFELIREPGKSPFEGVSYSQKESEQIVSKKVLEYYKKLGIVKPIPKEYLKFCM